MTRLLEEVINRVAKLTPEQQDELAARWLQELDDDARWDQRFATSQPELSKIARDVREQIRAGKVRSTGIDEL
jgi:hypothetical protein